METINKLNECELNGIEISNELADLLKMTQDEENGYLKANLDAVTEIAFYLSSEDIILDDEQSKKIRFSQIRDLNSIRNILKRLSKAVSISALVILEPELMSNLYDLGDIYLY